MKTAKASTSIEIWVTCPHCEDYQNRFEDLRENLWNGELRAEDCDTEIKCEECGKPFIVDEITY